MLNNQNTTTTNTKILKPGIGEFLRGAILEEDFPLTFHPAHRSSPNYPKLYSPLRYYPNVLIHLDAQLKKFIPVPRTIILPSINDIAIPPLIWGKVNEENGIYYVKYKPRSWLFLIEENNKKVFSVMEQYEPFCPGKIYVINHKDDSKKCLLLIQSNEPYFVIHQRDCLNIIFYDWQNEKLQKIKIIY